MFGFRLSCAARSRGQGNPLNDDGHSPAQPTAVVAAALYAHPAGRELRVYFEPDEDHWHGAAPDRFMVQLTVNEVDDERPGTVWGDKVTDEEYAAAPASRDGSLR